NFFVWPLFRLTLRCADLNLTNPFVSVCLYGRVSMTVRFVWVLLAASFVLSFTPRAFAQGSFFTSLSGTVADTSGAMIPGANVEVKNNGTGEKYNVVSGSDGGFTVASLPGGTYSVTVSLMGFKTS